MNPTPALPGATQQTSWLSRITSDARYLRAVLTFVSKASEEQLKQIPVIGPLLLGFAEAVKDLSEQEDGDQSRSRWLRRFYVYALANWSKASNWAGFACRP